MDDRSDSSMMQNQLSKNRYRRFGLRSLLVFVAITAIAFGLVTARYKTVDRFNDAYDIVEKETFAVLISGRSPKPLIGSYSHRAKLFSTGRFNLSVSDGETFCLEFECRSSGALFGKPVLQITRVNSFGSRPLNAEYNRELCAEIVDRMPRGTMTIVLRDKGATYLGEE